MPDYIAAEAEYSDLSEGFAGRAEPAARIFWVGAYLCDHACGGPEEGGWYYDCGEHVQADVYADIGMLPRAFLTAREAVTYCDEMTAALAPLNIGRRSKSSVLSQGIFEAHVIEEAQLPASFPAERPRYE